VGQAEDGLRGAAASKKQAEEILREATIALGYTKMVAPENGEVAKRLAEPGDLAWPGKPLVVLQTRGALRLEAMVREGLIQKVPVGSRLEVVLTAVGARVEGTVEERVPAADPQTRTFLVKVGLPPRGDLFPGMFGRLRVPVGKRKVILVPREAVKRVGQLDMVTVRSNGDWETCFVRTGREREGNVEILSGLEGGEIVALEGGLG
jgi:RND family efflux transporter MFP subunit